MIEETFNKVGDIISQVQSRGNGNSYQENLISILQEVQNEYGYLPLEELEEISRITKIPASKIMEVVTFYAQFRLDPVGKYIIMLCRGTACHVNGSNEILDKLEEYLQISAGETTENGLFTLETVSCLGCCSLAPAMMINGDVYGKLDGKKAVEIIKQIEKENFATENKEGN